MARSRGAEVSLQALVSLDRTAVGRTVARLIGYGSTRGERHQSHGRSMDGSTIAIIVSVVAVGIGLETLILPALRELRRDVADLRQRMAKLEGLFDGFTRRDRAEPAGGAPA